MISPLIMNPLSLSLFLMVSGLSDGLYPSLSLFMVCVSRICMLKGLRSIRFFKEIGEQHIESVTVNDFDPVAVEAIRRNIAFNGLPADRMLASNGDAM